MKHLTNQELARDLDNRRNALHNACQRNPELRQHLARVLSAMQEASFRLRMMEEKADPAPADIPQQPRRGRPKKVEA